MVIDASALLAVLLAERNGPWAAAQMNHHPPLFISTVNLTETLARLADLYPQRAKEVERTIFSQDFKFIPPDIVQARIAARARIRFRLNLGDCFAYALAVVENTPLLATDLDFTRVDIPVVLPPTGRR